MEQTLSQQHYLLAFLPNPFERILIGCFYQPNPVSIRTQNRTMSTCENWLDFLILDMKAREERKKPGE